MRRNAGVYQIKNTLDGKVYIGSSVNVYERFKNHERDLLKDRHQNIKLQLAWNKYGSANFEFKVIEFCAESELSVKEQQWIDQTQYTEEGLFDAGYNINRKSDRISFTPEVRAKMKQNHKGSTGYPVSEERKQASSQRMLGNKLGVGRAPRLGAKHSEEVKRKMSEKAKLSWTPERRAKMSDRMKGKKGAI